MNKYNDFFFYYNAIKGWVCCIEVSKICYSLMNYSGNTCISNIGDVNNQTLGKEWNTEERLTCRIADNCRGDEWMIIFQALFAEGKTDRISVRTLRSTSLSKNTIPEDAFTAF